MAYNPYNVASVIPKTQIDTSGQRKEDALSAQGQGRKLKKEYEDKNNFKYDMVMISRFDMCWMTDVIFDRFDSKYFWIPRVPMEKNTRTWYGWPFENPEINDYWCFGNSGDMDYFSLSFY